MRKIIISNTLWTVLEAVVAILVGLALARIFVRNLGTELYGLYLLLSLFSSYGILNMFDFGMGSAVTTYAARYQFAQPLKIKELWTFSIIYFISIAILASLTGLVIIRYYDLGITTRLESLAISRSVLIPTLILVGLTFLSNLVDSFLRGFSDFGYMQRTAVVLHLVRLLGIGFVITQGIYFDAIMWWLVGCTSARFLILLAYLHSRFPDFIRWSKFERNDVVLWTKYSIVLFISSITGFVFNVVDKLLITLFLPVVAMANYDIAAKPERMARGGLSVLLSAILPVSARYHALDQRDKLREMFLRGTNWLSMILIPPLVFITLMMSDFISLWVGKEHAWLTPLGQAMLCYLYFSFAASLANTMLVGMGLAKRQIPGQVASTAINLTISATFVHSFGLYGIVAGAFAGYVVAAVFYYALIWKELSIDINTLWRRLLMPNLVIVVIPWVLVCIKYLFRGNVDLFLFVCYGCFVVTSSYCIFYFFIMDKDDRMIVDDSYRNFIGRMRVMLSW